MPESTEICIIFNGKSLINTAQISSDNVFLHVSLPVKGGKGGFGSMLRAIGAQIEKTTNREACRDLSGRRLRDVNEEKRIKDWVKKQAEKKEEEEKKKKEKLKRLAAMTVPTSCQYNDDEFEKTRAEIPDIVEESINYGLQQSSKQQPSTSSSGKRKAEDIDDSNGEMGEASTSQTAKRQNTDSGKLIKKQTLWLGVDIDSDDSDDESEKDEGKVEDSKEKSISAAIEKE